MQQQAEFSTLSWLYRRSAAGDPSSEPIGFGWNAARGQSTITLPTLGIKYLEALATETGDDFMGAFLSPTGGTVIYATRPGPQNRVISLSSASVGYFGFSTYNGSPQGDFSGVIGYGVPSLAVDIPGNGSAAFSLYGFAAVRPGGAGTDARHYQLLGANSFDFSGRSISGSFATGVVTGYFPQFTQLSERFTFTSISYGSNGRFSGTLTVSGGATGAGEFEGWFAGPGARELLIKWKAPYRDPATGQTGTIYGVLAGKRS